MIDTIWAGCSGRNFSSKDSRSRVLVLVDMFGLSLSTGGVIHSFYGISAQENGFLLSESTCNHSCYLYNQSALFASLSDAPLTHRSGKETSEVS